MSRCPLRLLLCWNLAQPINTAATLNPLRSRHVVGHLARPQAPAYGPRALEANFWRHDGRARPHLLAATNPQNPILSLSAFPPNIAIAGTLTTATATTQGSPPPIGVEYPFVQVGLNGALDLARIVNCGRRIPGGGGGGVGEDHQGAPTRTPPSSAPPFPCIAAAPSLPRCPDGDRLRPR